MKHPSFREPVGYETKVRLHSYRNQVTILKLKRVAGNAIVFESLFEVASTNLFVTQIQEPIRDGLDVVELALDISHVFSAWNRVVDGHVASYFESR